MRLRRSDAARLASARDSTRSIAQPAAAIMRCDPVNTSRFRTIFAARSAFLVDLLQRRAHRLRRLGGLDQQLEMTEHPLQRVVHLVRDAGDELSERRELLRLRQAPAQRLALGLEPRLRA